VPAGTVPEGGCPGQNNGRVARCAKVFREAIMETKAKIKEVLVNLLKVKPDELKDGLSLQEAIGVDSTEMVESVIALEKAFGVKLSPKEITKSSSIDDIDKIIQSKIS
jgi:acyl carrier protein